MQSDVNLIHRIDIIERDVSDIKTRLDSVVSLRELQSMSETSTRIEDKLQQVTQKVEDVRLLVQAQELSAQKREAEIISNQNKLQIKVLGSILSVIVAIFSGLIIGYGTHLIH